MIAKFFYSSCIPFNVVRNPYWKKCITMLANGKLSGYIPPSSERLQTSLLTDVKSEVEQSLERKKFKWNTTGVSIVSGGWTDIQRRPLINFIAIARNEPIFLKAVDASGEYQDVEYLKQLFIEAIKEVGPDKVVQLITDNVAVCKSAGLSLSKFSGKISLQYAGCMQKSLRKDLLPNSFSER
ncbi:uncharacterized protein LOC116252971 isoform X2 [Nymphaea colorata]|uniref:uncharacterized protein LOC116252971 isoform X2 n=1 Tax=Nymphaea colorata TaxID=210225 RepID=UPI00129DD858|nr:uncharacterized protein LOC116252971 isoform X2 [Nymphaea colorata]XP_031483517.1 uncharacterized protein LOC116252971 isoform X2 [Nymphaea colorata]XP_049933601.1 uncharacterized protein LOC116252971 isoform X2 [Nymphaea colorata]